jgi:hypothetical protein
MNTYSRNGFKWNVNELLSLQREFELLKLSIDEIAQKHNRTPNAIMFKLDQEGLADYNVLYSNYHDLNAHIPVTRKHGSEINLEPVNTCDCEDDEDDEDDEEYFSEEEEEEEDEEEEDVKLSERVDLLENSISEIKEMIQQMMSSFNKKSTSKSWF